jgi:hypothetical protein
MKKIVLIIAVLMNFACEPDDKGKIEGQVLSVDPCTDNKEKKFEPFILSGEFFTILPDDDSAMIVMQDSYQVQTKSNGFYIQVLDIEEIKNKTGSFIEFDEKTIRANLVPLRDCPDFQIPLMASGKAKITDFGIKKGDHVRMDFEFDIVDGRSTDQEKKILGQGFTGYVDFKVKDYHPYQTFAGEM